jgi:UDP-N-acetylglucosamine--N-acetylmuramyl-(pentapeptide) pyrophosphoryl-undecaprenol N-acetylglucosamine transferase
LTGTNYPSLDGDIRLLIFGGSQGASIFSDAPVKAIAALPEKLRARLVVTHQAREKDLDAVKGAYAQAGVRADVAPFFTDLPQRMAAAHLVISRAGASTVTELAAIGRPSILVPLAIAMDDHQSGNARTLSGRKAAVILPEKEFNQYTLAAPLEALLTNPARLQEMAVNAKSAVKSGAAARLADLVEDIVARKAAA